MIYLDSGATTLQKPPQVAAAVANALRTMTTPGRGDHSPARQAAETVLQCRTEAAQLFGVENPENVVFTMNATHGLNLAIKSLVRPGDRVIISGYEHNAVTRPLHAIDKVETQVVSAPLFQPEQMAEGFWRELKKPAAAVICTHVSNVFGYRLPLEEIALLCKKQGVPLIVDASQSAGIYPVDMAQLGAAYIAMPGHKGLYGPQGTGILLCSERFLPMPLLEGGTGSLSQLQEMPDFLPDRLEAGTQNVHGIAGLLEGIRFVRHLGLSGIAGNESALMHQLEEGLRQMGGYQLFYGGQQSVLSVVPQQGECGAMAEWLGSEGVAVRSGLHCAATAHRTAGTDKTGTVRFSASVFNTPREIEQVLTLLRNRPV